MATHCRDRSCRSQELRGTFLFSKSGDGLKKRANRFRWKKRRFASQNRRRRTNTPGLHRPKFRRWANSQQISLGFDRLLTENKNKNWRVCESKNEPSIEVELERAEDNLNVTDINIGTYLTSVRAPDAIKTEILETLFEQEDELLGCNSNSPSHDQMPVLQYSSLDELDRRSLWRILSRLNPDIEHLSGSRRHELFSLLASPNSVRELLQDMSGADVPLDCSLRVLVLTAIAGLPSLQPLILRLMCEHASVQLLGERQQQIIFGMSAKVPVWRGTVELWTCLICKVVAQKDCAAMDRKSFFMGVALSLAYVFGIFMKSSVLASVHAIHVIKGAALLAQSHSLLATELLLLLLHAWPKSNSKKEVHCILLLGHLLAAAPPVGLTKLLQKKLSALLPKLLCSPQAQVAEASIQALQNNIQIYLRHIHPCQDFSRKVQEALHTNRLHWQPDVRAKADTLFDSLLDLT